MTFVNWISIGLVGIILLVGLSLRAYLKKRVRDLDGFMGIISSEHDGENNHTDR